MAGIGWRELAIVILVGLIVYAVVKLRGRVS
jgi:Sec-independent protein translocase protein TatA